MQFKTIIILVSFILNVEAGNKVVSIATTVGKVAGGVIGSTLAAQQPPVQQDAPAPPQQQLLAQNNYGGNNNGNGNGGNSNENGDGGNNNNESSDGNGNMNSGTDNQNSGSSILNKRAIPQPQTNPAPVTKVKDLTKEQKALYLKNLATKLASTLPTEKKDGLSSAQLKFMADVKKKNNKKA